MIAAVEVRQRKPKEGDAKVRKGGRYAGRLRLEVMPNRGEKALCGFVEAAVEPGTMVVTDGAPSYATLAARGNAFRSLLGIAGDAEAPTYDGLYSGEWEHPTLASHA